MPDDHALTKPGKPNRAAHVLFFAAVPPPDVKAQIEQAWQTHGTVDRFRQQTLHLSIHAVADVDEVDPVLIQRAQRAASYLRTAPFTLTFDRLRTFFRRSVHHPIALATDGGSHQPSEIAADLHSACRALGITASRSAKVTPHVTLAYGPGFTETRYLAQPIRWTVDELTLIDSIQGQGRHVPLGHWPLPTDRQQQGFNF